MQLFFTKHALDKLEVLARHHVAVTKTQVEAAVGSPDTVDTARAPLVFVEKTLNETHVLRLAYKQENDVAMILTFYPIKRKGNE